jgi:hypothetical protein
MIQALSSEVLRILREEMKSSAANADLTGSAAVSASATTNCTTQDQIQSMNTLSISVNDQRASKQAVKSSGMSGQGKWSYGGGPLTEDLEAVRLGLLRIRADIADLHVAVRPLPPTNQTPLTSPRATTCTSSTAGALSSRAMGGPLVSQEDGEIVFQRANLREMVREELKDIARGRLHRTRSKASWPGTGSHCTQQHADGNALCESHPGSPKAPASDFRLLVPSTASSAQDLSGGLRSISLMPSRSPSLAEDKRHKLVSGVSAASHEQYPAGLITQLQHLKTETGMVSVSQLPNRIGSHTALAVQSSVTSSDPAHDLQIATSSKVGRETSFEMGFLVCNFDEMEAAKQLVPENTDGSALTSTSTQKSDTHPCDLVRVVNDLDRRSPARNTRPVNRLGV